VSGEPDQMARVSEAATPESSVLAVEPEYFVYAFATPILSPLPDDEGGGQQEQEKQFGISAEAAAYLIGYRDAANHLTQTLLAGAAAGAATAGVGAAAINETLITWGLQATRVSSLPQTGAGIRLAVLDTGLDMNHPDFAGRPKVGASFVSGQSVQDGNGHGTHCIGTACGPRVPPVNPRYGIAHQSMIFAGKVLSNSGSGTDATILAGINWAIANGCPVISMSLGRGAQVGEPFPISYENAARIALQRGSLIIAAAGNDSNRSGGVFRPVSHPASCPSIMAVGAIDSSFRIANFSNRAINLNGGRVDLVGPGVTVRSTWPMPTRYRSISGTSMATPHVAGIAALYAQSSAAMRGAALWQKLIATAKNIGPIPAVDDGAGLVQA
jgi:subtilisin family serine protease